MSESSEKKKKKQIKIYKLIILFTIKSCHIHRTIYITLLIFIPFFKVLRRVKPSGVRWAFFCIISAPKLQSLKSKALTPNIGYFFKKRQYNVINIFSIYTYIFNYSFISNRTTTTKKFYKTS